MREPTPENGDCGSELARDSAHSPRGYSSLRLGRWSAKGVTYFVTFCTEIRRPGLTSGPVLAALQVERDAMEQEGAWQIRAWVVMPDHVHIVLDLCGRLTLGRTIARLKARSAHALRLAGLKWQTGYFDHRLRSIAELRPTLYHVLMNPVRAGLTDRGETWPGFHCAAEDWRWFADYARETVVEPAWLNLSEPVASKLAPTARPAVRR